MSGELGPLELLQSMSDGKVMDDFDEQLRLLLAAVKQSYKKGKIVLTISVKPPKDLNDQRVEIQGDVSATIPHVERSGEMLYLTENLYLTRRNPRQPAPPPNVVTMAEAGQGRELDRQSLAAGEK